MSNLKFYYEGIEDVTITVSSEASGYPKENLQDRNENTKWKSTYDELVSNGGFEDYTGTQDDGITDDFTSWTEQDGGDGYVDSTATAHNGSSAVKIHRGTALAYINQDITVDANCYYNLSFWARGDGTNAGRYDVYDLSNGAYIISRTSTGVTGTTYEKVEESFYTPDGCTSIRISFIDTGVDGTDTYFDDISLIQWPHIILDYGSGYYHSSLILGGHNIYTVGGTVYIDTSDDGSTWSNAASDTPTSDDPFLLEFYVPLQKRYWRVRITGITAAVTIGTLFLGDEFEHSVNVKEVGNIEGRMSGTDIRETIGGQRFSNNNYALRRIWEMTWENISETHHDNFFTWSEYVKNNHLPFYFDPGDGDLYLVRYMSDTFTLSDVAYQLYNTGRIRLEQEL